MQSAISCMTFNYRYGLFAAVFVSRVLKRNKGMSLESINWETENKELGCTFELCSGDVKDCNQDMDVRYHKS